MNRIKTVDISNINCWIVNLKPFDSNANSAEIYNFQQKCVKNKVFGIGWWNTDYDMGAENIICLKANRDTYLKEYGKVLPAMQNATDAMMKIRKGDFVIMRLRDAHYYLGRVSDEAFHKNDLFADKSDNQIMSWVCSVEKWYEFKTDEELPSEICGRFSQRRQPTITRIVNYRQKLLTIAAYEKKSGINVVGVPKIRLTVDNFARSLNYMELEDLVCAYIYNRHYDDKYMLLPSSGKVSQMKYEFTFVSGVMNRKPITCQVKNQNKTSIEVSDYANDADKYEIIYLFSGNKNISNEYNININNIVIIDSYELYKELTQQENMAFLREKLCRYYTFDDSYYSIEDIERKLNEYGWQRVEHLKKNNTNNYMISAGGEGESGTVTRWLSLGYNWSYYYADDFGCFVKEKGSEVDITDLVKEIFGY